MDPRALLNDWTREWLLSRDAVNRRIVSIDQKNENEASGLLVVHRSDGDQRVIIQPILEGNWSSEAATANMIVTLNTPENVRAVVSEWSVLVKNEKLLVVFCNPKARGDQKWIVKPSTHNKIADSSSLRQGLLTMSEQVETLKE